MLSKIIQFLKLVWRANPKTLYFNFTYLPWQQAIRLPVWVSSKTYLLCTKGNIRIEGDIHSGMIRIGYGKIGIFDKKRSRSIWECMGSVIFKGPAEIGHGSKISVGGQGELTLGKQFTITAESTIIAYKEIRFGNNCLLSWDILVMDSDFHTIRDAQSHILNEPAPIIIGDSVWIGCRCLILKNTRIPSGSVVAANSFVNKQLSGENQLFGGNPLNILKQDISWDR